MKNSTFGMLRVCSIFFLLISWSHFSLAQNKTLGVGVTTPNANAALHVESPGANQGFIMPRLTTLQRNAMTAVLTAADNGLMLYDTDLKSVFLWNGAAWASTGKLTLPYKDSIATATGTNDLFALKYNNAELKRVMRIENLNPGNVASSLSVLQQGSGVAGFFQVNNATNGGTVVNATTNSNLGGVLAPVAIYGESTGSGSLGAAFRINNAANNYPTVFMETNGVGNVLSLNNINASNSVPALTINQSGPGLAISSNAGINLSSSNAATVSATQTGAASAGNFTISNASSSAATILSNSNSTVGGSAIYAVASGSQNHAGVFSSTNNANTSPALAVMTTSTAGAPALLVNQSGTGLGIDMNGGTLKYSYATVNTAGGAITTRTGVIEITSLGTFTFGWGAIAGEICIVMNNTGSGSITVEGQLLSNLQIAQFVYIAGAWRKL
jgi:hypothetical protein